jgi:hypothetical protein
VLNPTDLLNPPKDPTDPSLQRAGAWLARLELPYERFTLTFVGAARALREVGGRAHGAGGVADARPRDPEYDDQAHVAAVARLYLLLADSDSTSSTSSPTSTTTPSATRAASASPSRGWSARPSRSPGGAGAAGLGAPLRRRLRDGAACRGPDIVSRSKLDSPRRNVHALLGARYTFSDDSLLGADYLYQSDGYDQREWRALLTALRLANQAGLALPTMATTPGGTPQRFSFEPLRATTSSSIT